MLTLLLRNLALLCVVAVIASLPLAALATSPELIAMDSTFSVAGGVLDTAPGGDAVVTGEPNAGLPIGASLHLELELAAPETPGSFGFPTLVGSAESGPDLIVSDGVTTYLTADVSFIELTGFSNDGAFNLSSITLGALDGGSDIDVTGGTLAPIFNSVGTFSLLLFDMNFAGQAPNLFDPDFEFFGTDFASGMRFTMQTSPEPGTGVLLALGLIGLAARRRRNA